MCLREAVEEEHRGACAARSHCDRGDAHIDDLVLKTLEHTVKFPLLTPPPGFATATWRGALRGVDATRDHRSPTGVR
jgi:hypothetical protein